MCPTPYRLFYALGLVNRPPIYTFPFEILGWGPAFNILHYRDFFLGRVIADDYSLAILVKLTTMRYTFPNSKIEHQFIVADVHPTSQRDELAQVALECTAPEALVEINPENLNGSRSGASVNPVLSAAATILGVPITVCQDVGSELTEECSGVLCGANSRAMVYQWQTPVPGPILRANLLKAALTLWSGYTQQQTCPSLLTPVDLR
ncbi:hypothetical protein P691DRAFT_788150 [Macrolepiota fuliginosa MF-IS2]|uniref:Uncharacterized protein n=1 Tax=Macrolepiota fuliginosa MF-IS2 TaxID=1400762 RepID=A0A9P5X2M1_9AGAR|nr:hypothetical protein P691DRAFT_788150 [Macrolepiota fuliginosa MF-IS2]